jgi:Iron-containing redox enzyme
MQSLANIPSACDDEGLLRACVRGMGAQLSAVEKSALQRWWTVQQRRSGPLVTELLAQSESAWIVAVLQHRAHRHAFYEELAERADVVEFAGFLLENWALPPFLTLVERALQVQICDVSCTALLRNIKDELLPKPHAELMRNLMTAIKERAGAGVSLELGQSLIDRTLIFHYGYYCEPWNLVGSLFATEMMGQHRMTRMGAGLTRLGFQPSELEFIRVHIECDEGHACEWMESVLIPSIRANPELRAPIAAGIAACLVTSGHYLDDLSRRALRRRVRLS